MADDYTGSTATTGRATVGGSSSGNLETVGDLDWFKVSLVSGNSYIFTLTSTGAATGLEDPYLRLYSSDGTTLIAENDDDNSDTGVGGLDSQITATISASGSYYLEASSGSDPEAPAIGSRMGNYILSVSLPIKDDRTANVSTTGSVAPGKSVTGELEIAGDSDWFAVSLVAGKAYTFSLESSATNGLGDAFLSLYDSAGVLITTNDDRQALNGEIVPDSEVLNSEISFTVSTTGTYYLGASSGSSGDGTGNYKLSASVPIVDDYPATVLTTGKLVAAGSTTGNLESVGDHDWFSISLTAGQQYTFALDSAATGGLEDPFLSLYDKNGTLLSTNDDGNGVNSELTYIATVTGNFYLGASSSTQGTSIGKGGYTLSASAPSVPASDAIVKVNGTTSNDFLNVGVGNYDFDGGTGTDTLVFTGSLGGYSIQQIAGGYSIGEIGGATSTVTLSAIERVQFADKKIAFDLDGNAGNTAKLIGAALGTEFLKPAYDNIKGAVLTIFDSGVTMKQLAASVVGLKEFIQLEGTNSNTDFVKYVYRAVTGQVASAGDVALLAKILDDGMTQGDFLATVADMNFNVDMVGLAKTGIEYI